MAVLFLTACSRQGATLESIEKQMNSQLARVPLGDFSGFTFEPPVQADWFVVYPAGATEGAFFAVSPALRAYAPQLPAEILKQPEPGMAFLTDGKVSDRRELVPAFNAKRVFAKPGKVSYGIRFVRLMGARRNYDIQGID